MESHPQVRSLKCKSSSFLCFLRFLKRTIRWVGNIPRLGECQISNLKEFMLDDSDSTILEVFKEWKEEAD
jgi:hypothetical protein